MAAVNLDAMLARFAEHWSPKKIAQIDDYDVRIVKIEGEFTGNEHKKYQCLFYFDRMQAGRMNVANGNTDR